jgi:Fe-S cluster biogenesis protein NfuA
MTGNEIQQRLQKVEELVRAVEAGSDPHARASAVELVQTLLELHGAGIERMLEMVFDAAGGELIDRIADDEAVSGLLLLHGLHPLDIETRVAQALDRVRPMLHAHGGDVELLGVREGVVQLRLQGSCNGCSSSAATLEQAIKEAVYEAAPDVVALEVEGVTPPPAPHALVQLARAPAG